MSLFRPPERKESAIENVLDIVENEAIPKAKIKLRGTSLLAKLKVIEETVERNLGDEKNNYLLLTTDEEWLSYCKKACEDGIIAIDTECAGLEYDEQKQIAGVCAYSHSQKPAYTPVGHISSITGQLLPNQISKQAVTDGFKMMVQANVKFIFHNAYFDLLVLKLCTDIWLDVYWDTMPASFLLNENESHGLKYLYDKYIMNGGAGVHKFAELFGHEIPINMIPTKVAGIYSAHDALMTYKLYEFQKPYFIKGTPECTEYNLSGVGNVLFNEELPIISVLAKMKYRGLKIDLEIAYKLKQRYEKLRDDAEHKFQIAVAPLEQEVRKEMLTNGIMEWPVNYNSPAQMKVIIYDILKSGVIFKKEPTGTGKHVLDTVLADKKYKGTVLYKIVETLVDVKKYDKALNTFIAKIIDLAEHDKDNVVRPDFNSCRARTGRLSSSGSINVQQIPSKMGDIRNMFTAGNGRVYISADIKKQEVAVASIVSGDKKLQDALNSGLDVYSYIASIAYGNKYEDNLEHYPNGDTNVEGKKRRSASKAVVLGCLYSKGVKSIGEDLHIPTDKAQEVYDAVMKAFPDLAKWIKATQEQAKKDNYVDGMFGRRRRLPDLSLPPYEFTYKVDVDKATEEYYNNYYSKLLDDTYSQAEKQKIILDAKNKGIEIKQNGGFIAKAERECVNSCVVHDTAILTKQYGIKPIGELSNKGKFDVFDGESFVQCDGVVSSGVKQKYIITFNDGSIIECSPNHRFLYMNTCGNTRFSTAEELRLKTKDTNNPPMVVAQDTSARFSGQQNILPMIEVVACNANRYSFNSIDDKFELGYLLGWLQGDGSVYASGNRGNYVSWLVYENKYDAREYIFSILSKYFHVAIKHVSVGWLKAHGKPYATQEYTRYSVYSKTLASQAVAIGIKSRVPDIVMASSEMARGYVAGLFDTDGGFSGESAQITFGRIHEQENLARGVQTLLFSLGIRSHVSLLKDRIRVVIIKLHNQRYGEVVGSLIKRKQHKFEVHANKHTTTFRYAGTKRIRSIEVTDEYVPMFDVINSATHRFVANGVVTHNCVQGSSADICKIIIVSIAKNKRLQELGCKLEMSIHDEQLVSCPKESAWEVAQILTKITADSTGDTPVKLGVDIAVSDVWYGDEYKFNDKHQLVRG